MDLTKTYPRSVHDRLAGIVQIGRTIDKARAYTAGKLGEYHYNCSMDQAVFSFLGVGSHEAFAREVATGSDAELAQFIRDRYLSGKSQTEIEKWNHDWVLHGPEPGSEGQSYFVELRDQVAPGRTDVTAWADLLDLDEGREVARRAA